MNHRFNRLLRLPSSFRNQKAIFQSEALIEVDEQTLEDTTEFLRDVQRLRTDKGKEMMADSEGKREDLP